MEGTAEGRPLDDPIEKTRWSWRPKLVRTNNSLFVIYLGLKSRWDRVAPAARSESALKRLAAVQLRPWPHILKDLM
jgi:hypothetical protein